MGDKSEKERRKQLLNQVRQKEREDFDKSLPMSRDNFKKLFDYLDVELSKNGCNRSNTLTRSFLNHTKIGNVDGVLDWLSENGGYCDCEILANCEDQFE